MILSNLEQGTTDAINMRSLYATEGNKTEKYTKLDLVQMRYELFLNDQMTRGVLRIMQIHTELNCNHLSVTLTHNVDKSHVSIV